LCEELIDDAVATTKRMATEFKQRLQRAVMTRVGELYFVCASSRIRMSPTLLSATQSIQLFEMKTAPLRKAMVAAKKSDAHRTHHDFQPSVTLSDNYAILDYHGF